MQTMTESRKYNGWTNYETWNVSLWLDNDHGTYTYVREMADKIKAGAPEDNNVLGGIWTVEQTTRFRFADALKDYVEEMAPDLGASMFADLLGAALSEVDWHEIADHVLSE